MRLHASARFRIALVVLLCLLFQQAAMAAYACNMQRASAPAPAAASMDMAEHCAGMPSGHDPGPAALCEKHCVPDRSTAAEHPPLSVPALAGWPVRFAPPPSLADVRLAQGEDAFDRSDPPARLRYCSLLI